jgi:hypothetical protein
LENEREEDKKEGEWLMEGLFHLTSPLADDFLHDRLSERDQSAITLHLEKCQDCRRLRRKNGRGQECSLAITR